MWMRWQKKKCDVTGVGYHIYKVFINFSFLIIKREML